MLRPDTCVSRVGGTDALGAPPGELDLDVSFVGDPGRVEAGPVPVVDVVVASKAH